VISKVKLYSKLDAIENQLKEELLPHLRMAAEGKNDLVFCVSQFNSFRDLKNQTDMKMEEFVELGAQILSLRNKLGEPSDGIIAERICWYCREWNLAYKSEKAAGVRLAKQFLGEVESKQQIR